MIHLESNRNTVAKIVAGQIDLVVESDGLDEVIVELMLRQIRIGQTNMMGMMTSGDIQSWKVHVVEIDVSCGTDREMHCFVLFVLPLSWRMT